MSSKKQYFKILWVEDDRFFRNDYTIEFTNKGYTVIYAETGTKALEILEKNKGKFDLVVTDVRINPGKSLAPEITHGGNRTGIVVASICKKKYPRIPIIGFSIISSPEIINWFNHHAEAYIVKNIDMRDPEIFVTRAERIIKGKLNIKEYPKIFIVHGQDDKTKLELKNYIQNTLKLGEPIILHEKPNMGRTIIEKFEEETRYIDVVFILLTPDDKTIKIKSNEEKRRARQNVIFEAGYFYGKLGRRSGKIILLYKDQLELPSDISGIIYIDISNGIDAAGENIRKEIKELLI